MYTKEEITLTLDDKRKRALEICGRDYKYKILY